ncbi:MAG TPA: type VI secretion system tube protein Hcp [Pirellulales bacterium]
MGVDPFDAFIEFKGGNSPKGESLDNVFGPKKACEIDEFEFGADSFLPPDSEKSSKNSGGDINNRFDDDTDEGEEVAEKAKRDDVRTFEIGKRIDTASVALFQAYCSAAADIAKAIKYDEVTVSVRKPGDPPVVYLEVKFKTVYVAEYQLSISESDLLPYEKISFYFRDVTVNYTPIDATGAASSVITALWRF